MTMILILKSTHFHCNYVITREPCSGLRKWSCKSFKRDISAEKSKLTMSQCYAMHCLGLGTKTSWLRWEKCHGLALNTCFVHHDHGWRRSNLHWKIASFGLHKNCEGVRECMSKLVQKSRCVCFVQLWVMLQLPLQLSSPDSKSIHMIGQMWTRRWKNEALFFCRNKSMHREEVTVELSFCSALQVLEKDKSSQMRYNFIRRVCLKSNCKWKINPTRAGPPPLTTCPLTKNTLPYGRGREREREMFLFDI